MITAPDMTSARAYAESLMTSTCTIREPGAEPVTDATTGEVTFPAGATVYSGPCRVRPVSSRGGGTTEAGGAQMFTFDYLVSVPFAATGIREGMPCHIDSSPDPDVVNAEFEIQKVDRGEHITARRLSCSEVA